MNKDLRGGWQYRCTGFMATYLHEVYFSKIPSSRFSHFMQPESVCWQLLRWAIPLLLCDRVGCRGLWKLLECVFCPVQGTNVLAALISDKSSPPPLLMACGSILLLLCSRSIDWRCWPAPTAHRPGRGVIGVVCVCVLPQILSGGAVLAVMFE